MLPNLKKLRLMNQISQNKLGEAIGVSQQSINKYENHNIEPDISTLKLLADYFNTSIDYIVGHTDIDRPFDQSMFHELSKEEYVHMKNYKKLNIHEKENIDATIKLFIKSKR